MAIGPNAIQSSASGAAHVSNSDVDPDPGLFGQVGSGSSSGMIAPGPVLIFLTWKSEYLLKILIQSVQFIFDYVQIVISWEKS